MPLQWSSKRITVAGVTQVDTEHLVVNNRPILSSHFYKVALPQSLAEAQKLAKTHASVDSLLDKTDARLREARSSSALTGAAVAKGLEEEFSQRDHVYLELNPAHFNWFQARP